MSCDRGLDGDDIVYLDPLPPRHNLSVFILSKKSDRIERNLLKFSFSKSSSFWLDKGYLCTVNQIEPIWFRVADQVPRQNQN